MFADLFMRSHITDCLPNHDQITHRKIIQPNCTLIYNHYIYIKRNLFYFVSVEPAKNLIFFSSAPFLHAALGHPRQIERVPARLQPFPIPQITFSHITHLLGLLLVQILQQTLKQTLRQTHQIRNLMVSTQLPSLLHYEHLVLTERAHPNPLHQRQIIIAKLSSLA